MYNLLGVDGQLPCWEISSDCDSVRLPRISTRTIRHLLMHRHIPHRLEISLAINNRLALEHTDIREAITHLSNRIRLVMTRQRQDSRLAIASLTQVASPAMANWPPLLRIKARNSVTVHTA